MKRKVSTIGAPRWIRPCGCVEDFFKRVVEQCKKHKELDMALAALEKRK